MSFDESTDRSSGFRELWTAFSGTANQNEYCQAWLDLQCARIDHALRATLILRTGEQESDAFEPVGVWPEAEELFPPLMELAERVIEEECGLVSEFEMPPGTEHKGLSTYTVGYPLKVEGEIAGVVAMAMGVKHERELAEAMEQLQWGISWVELMIRRHQQTRQAHDLPRLKSAVEILAAVLADPGFESACLTFVTELSETLGCERVSLGMLHLGRIKFKAVSHSSQFGKQMNLTKMLTAAMEEAVFQKMEIRFPDDSEGHLVTREHAQLAALHGCGASYTLPLFAQDSYYGAITLERATEQPFREEELETVRAIAALAGEVLREKRENDRPLIVKARDEIHTQLGRVLGPGYLGRKLFLLVSLALVAFVSTVNGTYRVAADSQLEGMVRQVAVAPFAGYIEASTVRAGDLVEQGQVLCRLDDRDLSLERINWMSELAKLSRQYEEALARRERGRAKVLAAQQEQAKARLELVDSRLARTVIRAPFAGFVVSGDLTQRLGGAVEQGEVLFELSPLNAYRAILWVDEHQVADISEGDSGTLVLKSLPDEKYQLSITRITPITQARDGGNHFRVESVLENPSARLRPGMEGIGKIEVGDRKLISIYLGPLLRWLKLQYWALVP